MPTTATKPSSFLRSSENTGDVEAQARAEVRRLTKLEALDPRGFDWEDGCRERARMSCGLGARRSGLVEPLQREDKSDRLVAQMAAEDTSRLDTEGRVF